MRLSANTYAATTTEPTLEEQLAAPSAAFSRSPDPIHGIPQPPNPTPYPHAAPENPPDQPIQSPVWRVTR